MLFKQSPKDEPEFENKKRAFIELDGPTTQLIIIYRFFFSFFSISLLVQKAEFISRTDLCGLLFHSMKIEI